MILSRYQFSKSIKESQTVSSANRLRTRILLLIVLAIAVLVPKLLNPNIGSFEFAYFETANTNLSAQVNQIVFIDTAISDSEVLARSIRSHTAVVFWIQNTKVELKRLLKHWRITPIFSQFIWFPMVILQA